MDAKHVTFEGVYRLFPSRAQCAREGAFSLGAILSVTDGRLRRLEFVRLEDTSDLNVLDAKEESVSTVNDHPCPAYAFLIGESLGKKPDPMPEALTSKIAFAKTQLYLAVDEVTRGCKEPSDFAFWGDEAHLPRDYRHYAFHATGNMAQSIELMRDKRLAVLDMQDSVRRYGLTREIVEKELSTHVKDGSIGKEVARQMKKAFKRLAFSAPERYRDEPFAASQEGASLFPQGEPTAACPFPQPAAPCAAGFARVLSPLRRAMAAFL